MSSVLCQRFPYVWGIIEGPLFFFNITEIEDRGLGLLLRSRYHSFYVFMIMEKEEKVSGLVLLTTRKRREDVCKESSGPGLETLGGPTGPIWFTRLVTIQTLILSLFCVILRNN